MLNLITLNNISYRINGKDILYNINCAIDNHGILAILGPNGAGKTTLLKLMAKLIEPTGGEINFNYDLPIGFVFQKPILLNRSVKDNFIHALKNSINTKETPHNDIVKSVLLKNNILHLANKSAKKLSGGEQQLVSILRACIVDPKVLFFDEPTSNLDHEHKSIIEQLIIELSKKTKIIIVSQDHEMAKKLATKILILNRGTITYD